MTLVIEIKTRIQALFGDTSVSPQTTRANLEGLRDMLDEMIDTLPEEDDDK